MIFRREKVINKKIKVYSSRFSKKEITLQKYLRTTWWILFIPVFIYDKRIDWEKDLVWR